MPSALVGCLNEVPKNIRFLVQDLAIVAGGFAGAGFQCLLCYFDKHAHLFSTNCLFFCVEDSPSFSDIRDDSGRTFHGHKAVVFVGGTHEPSCGCYEFHLVSSLTGRSGWPQAGSFLGGMF